MGIDPQVSGELAKSGLIMESLRENELMSESKQIKFKSRLRSSFAIFTNSGLRISRNEIKVEVPNIMMTNVQTENEEEPGFNCDALINSSLYRIFLTPFLLN